MEGFDFSALFNKNKNRHKMKPPQFISTDKGVKKRLQTNLKHRKSTRMTTFDVVRDLTHSPLSGQRVDLGVEISEDQLKAERRRQQLEKWKEEKEKRKKEQAAQKKKPFVTGVARAPLMYAPPPPLAPSTSGRVTRSLTQSKIRVPKKIEQKPEKPMQSFAPKNALFRPPEMKHLLKVPTLAPVINSKKENKGFVFIFPTKENEINVKTRANKPATERMMMTRGRAKELKNEREILKGRDAIRQNHMLMKSTKNTVSSSETKSVEGPLLSKRNTTRSRTKINDAISKCVPSIESDSEYNSLHSPKSTGEAPIVIDRPLSKRNTSRKSQTKINNATPKCESRSEPNSEHALHSLNSAGDGMSSEVATTPVAAAGSSISPCVTASRGKRNAMKEQKEKLKEGCLQDYNCAIKLRDELDCEIVHLTKMCDTWDKIREQTPLPENVQEEVLAAVGQGRLLMSSKLQQFAGLVDQCAHSVPGAPVRVTGADLQGFWDMVSIQIEKVDMRFKRLEKLKENNWVDEQTTKPKTYQKPTTYTKKTAKPAVGTSKLREMIAAARKAKKDENVPTTTNTTESSVVTEEKVFEAGFFCVKSPVRCPAPGTPINNGTLLKNVLSNEARKATSCMSPFAILRASEMSKALEFEGIAPLPQTPLASIHLNATPGRSILKSENRAQRAAKPIKMVLFDSDTQTPFKANTEETNTASQQLSLEEDKENSQGKSKSNKQHVEVRTVITRSVAKSDSTLQVASDSSSTVSKSRRTPKEKAADNIEVTPMVKRRSTRRKSLAVNKDI